jgi:N-acetylmuramoyl-L-alanine amidase
MRNEHGKIKKETFYIPADDEEYERIKSAQRGRNLRRRLPDWLGRCVQVRGFVPLSASMAVLLVVCCFFGIYRLLNRNSFDSKAAVAPVYDDQYAEEGATAAVDVSDRDRKVICLDAGHGGSDAGAEYKKTYEKDQCLEMVKLVRTELENEGYTVVLTRESDTNPSLDERVKLAEDANASVLVSIHRNFYQGDSKSGGNTAKGIECWIGASNPADANQLSTRILNELMKLSLTTNRGVKTGTINNANRNYKINTSKCTSCILELGFITNTNDDVLVTTKKAECARAIAQGIISYLGSLQ